MRYMLTAIAICVSTIGCSQGMKTDTMTREEAKEFREKGHLAEAVKLSKPVQYGNYLWWQGHVERVNALAQNSLITVLFVTDFDGNIATYPDGSPIGPFVVAGMNDGVIQVSAEALALGAAQVATAFVNGEYYVKGMKVQGKAQVAAQRSASKAAVEVAKLDKEGDIGSAKWLSQKGPDTVIDQNIDNGASSASTSDVLTEANVSANPTTKVATGGVDVKTSDYGTFSNDLEGAKVQGLQLTNASTNNVKGTNTNASKTDVAANLSGGNNTAQGGSTGPQTLTASPQVTANSATGPVTSGSTANLDGKLSATGGKVGNVGASTGPINAIGGEGGSNGPITVAPVQTTESKSGAVVDGVSAVAKSPVNVAQEQGGQNQTQDQDQEQADNSKHEATGTGSGTASNQTEVKTNQNQPPADNSGS